MARNKSSDKTVVRISASEEGDSSAPAKARKEPTKPRKVTKKTVETGETRQRGAFVGYFAGAWYELRQVRWPNRRATWSLTAAVLGFSAFFVVLILLLDAFFKYVFELLLK